MMERAPCEPDTPATDPAAKTGLAHAPGLEQFSDYPSNPTLPPGEAPVSPRPDLKRERRNQRIACCCALVVMLAMSALGGVAAYYLYFKLPPPF